MNSSAMTNILSVLLSANISEFRTDVIIWILLAIAGIGAAVTLYFQVRRKKDFENELDSLAKMRKNNVEYEMVLKAMKLCTWHIDTTTRMITFDDDFRDKLDSYTPVEGTTVDEFVKQMADWDREKVNIALEDICSGRVEEYNQTYQVKNPHGNNIYWSHSFGVVSERDEQGLPTTIVGASMRIDDQKEMEANLISARNMAEESDRLKTHFLANITHEVRTPLNAIVGFSDVIAMAQTDEERRALVAIVKENTNKLLRIFDDMMNMSKAEASEKDIVKEEFDVNIVILELISEFSDKTTLTITSEIQETPKIICSDKSKVKEIITHYLSNAVKFTPDGAISVGYEEPNDKTIIIYVQDTGKGIPQEDQERIFERFVKLDEFVQGAGLGLSVVKADAEALGGKTGVLSSVGIGSRFWVELPTA